MRYCCNELKYSVETGDITHDTEGNKFYAYGAPMPDGTTKCMQMSHCLFCGTHLIPSPPTKGELTLEHTCSNCAHQFQVNLFSKAVVCPECGNWDIEGIGVAKT